MTWPAPLRSRLLWALLLAIVSTELLAVGKPEWARPYLNLPAPAGGYIARADKWAILYGEVEYSVAPSGGVRETRRYIYENLQPIDDALVLSISFDEGLQELSEMALSVQRSLLWHKVNFAQSSVQADWKAAHRLILTGVEKVAPGHRVVVEYTLTARHGLLPFTWHNLLEDVPTACLHLRREAGAGDSLALELVLPKGDPLPPSFVREGDGSLTVREIPARGRLVSALAFQPERSDLFPWVKISVGPSGTNERDFIRKYGEAWAKARKANDNPGLAAKALALTQGTSSVQEKVRRITSFVQHGIQNDGTNESSINAWVPLEAGEVLRSLKADCKGKSLLAQELLQAVGVESRPILLRFDAGYYTWGAEPVTTFINHVVLAVHLEGDFSQPATLQEGPAKGWVLFDPTLDTVSFGQPLPGFEGRPALLVQDEQPPRFTIQTLVPSAASDTMRVRFRVEAGGAVDCEMTLRGNGACPLLRRLSDTSTAEDMDRIVREAFPPSLNRVEVRGIRARRAGEGETAQAEVEIRVRFPAAAQVLASGLLLESPIALAAHLRGLPHGYWARPPAAKDEAVVLVAPWDNRKNSHGIEELLEVDAALELPSGYDATLPPPRVEETPYLSFRIGWARASAGQWRGTLHLVRKRGSWPASGRKERLTLEDSLFSDLYKSIELKKS